MGALIRARRVRTWVAAALLIAAPSHGQERGDGPGRWQPYVAEASARFDIPATWIERVIRAESAGRTHLNGRPITSSAGAMGLMQLMPGTWAELRAAHGLGNDPHDPRDNILAGTAYLRAMYDRFGYPGLFAAYNAGPARYAAFLAGRQPLPAETRAYLAGVAGPASSPSEPPGKLPDTVFALHRTAGEQSTQTEADPPQDSRLFVPLSRD